MSVDSLQNMIADYQWGEAREIGIDLDPSDAFASVFRKLGWSEPDIAAAVADSTPPWRNSCWTR